MKLIIGIDPGITGAVGAVDQYGRYIGFFDLPSVEKKSSKKSGTKAKVKRKIDAKKMYECMIELIHDVPIDEVRVIIEGQAAMPPPKNKKDDEQRSMGAASLMSLGHTHGMIEAVVQVMRLEYTTVYPREWKTYYKIPGEQNGGKKYALAVARMLFRDAPLKLVKHHNRAEALLIAKFGFDKFVE